MIDHQQIINAELYELAKIDSEKFLNLINECLVIHEQKFDKDFLEEHKDSLPNFYALECKLVFINNFSLFSEFDSLMKIVNSLIIGLNLKIDQRSIYDILPTNNDGSNWIKLDEKNPPPYGKYWVAFKTNIGSINYTSCDFTKVKVGEDNYRDTWYVEVSGGHVIQQSNITHYRRIIGINGDLV